MGACALLAAIVALRASGPTIVANGGSVEAAVGAASLHSGM
jgi:hypothetical protein